MFVSKGSRNLLPDLSGHRSRDGRRRLVRCGAPQAMKGGRRFRRPPSCQKLLQALSSASRTENYIGSSISSSALPIVETEKMTATLIAIMEIDQKG